MRAALAMVLAVGCGRVDFGSAASNTVDAIDDARAMTGSGDTAPTAISYVGPVAMTWMTMGSSITFNLQAANAGDAVVVLFACAGSQMPISGALAGGAWSFSPVTAVYGSAGNQLWGQTFGAIAPDTSPVTITATWTAANCNRGLSVLGDELTGVDPGGGAITFDADAEMVGAVGPVTGSVITAHAGDTVWAAAYSGMALTAVGSGYTKAADDGNGDWSEYKLTADPAGTTEPVTFSSPAQPWLLGVVTLKPR
jgi:hypothetical protein